MDGIFSNQIVIGLILAIPSFALGLLAFLRSRKIDKRNAAAENLDEIFEGNQKLIANLQLDNENLRKRVVKLEEGLVDLQRQHDEVITERNKLSHQLIKTQQENVSLRQKLTELQGA